MDGTCAATGRINTEDATQDKSRGQVQPKTLTGDFAKHIWEHNRFADLWAKRGAGVSEDIWFTKHKNKWTDVRCMRATWDGSDDKSREHC